jgi:hypothetical protein
VGVQQTEDLPDHAKFQELLKVFEAKENAPTASGVEEKPSF